MPEGVDARQARASGGMASKQGLALPLACRQRGAALKEVAENRAELGDERGVRRDDTWDRLALVRS